MRTRKPSLEPPEALAPSIEAAPLLEAPACWACAALVGWNGAVAFSGWPLRRNGTLRAPAPGRLLIVAWLCEACQGAPWVARSRATILPLSLLYSTAEADATAERLRREPWWSEKVARALALGAALSRIKEQDDGPLIEAAVAESQRSGS